MQWAWYVEDGIKDLITDNVVLVDGDVELGKGVALVWTPGHTDGNHSLCINTEDGVWVSSENGVAADSWHPHLSKIPGVRKTAEFFGREVILNSNTLEDSIDQYDSMLKEKALADPNKRDPRWLNVFPSSEMASWKRQWPAVPTFVYGGINCGIDRAPASRATEPCAHARAALEARRRGEAAAPPGSARRPAPSAARPGPDHAGRADRLGPLERPARPVEAEPHRDVDVLGRGDALADGEVGLVDDLAEDPSEDQPGRVADPLDVLAHGAEVASRAASASAEVVAGRRASSTRVAVSRLGPGPRSGPSPRSRRSLAPARIAIRPAPDRRAGAAPWP